MNIKKLVSASLAFPIAMTTGCLANFPQDLDTVGTKSQRGTYNIEDGFHHDSNSIPIIAGGNEPINLTGIPDSDCFLGYFSVKPQLIIQVDNTDELVGFFSQGGFDDVILLVNTPSGKWLCNDNADDRTFGGLVAIGDVEVGQYRIFVGTAKLYRAEALFQMTTVARN